MASEFKTRIKQKHDTTTNWNAAIGFIPLPGEVIIYDDYTSFEYEKDGTILTKTVPGIKIGTGNAYVQDLPFVDEDVRDSLIRHIENDQIHLAPGEKQFWSNKINIDDAEDVISNELQDETLIFTRN